MGTIRYPLVIAFIYAIYSNRTKNKISLKLTDKVKAEVYYGNLFDAQEIIVIPVNEYFDTIVDDKIISSKTVHGKFIKIFLTEMKLI
ncbi:DUF6430 domain-containing protein [Plesiomonas shigelloides subsp. oncorhynchi]|nr:DUF6430 domain-containing protein [Plesiomonas shigelloides]